MTLKIINVNFVSVQNLNLIFAGPPWGIFQFRKRVEVLNSAGTLSTVAKFDIYVVYHMTLKATGLTISDTKH